MMRALTRSPASTLAAVAITAIGTALATLGLALFDTIQWRPISLPSAAGVVVLSGRHESPRGVRPSVNWSFARAQFVSRHATTVELTEPWRPASVTLTGPGTPVPLRGEFVSGGYFQLVGAAPVVGRGFDADEVVATDPRAVVVVSEAFRLRRQAAGDPLHVGAPLRLNGHDVTIIGVMADGFGGLTGTADVWLPMPMAPVLTYPEFLTTNQDFITLLARRKPGVPAAQLHREIAQLAADAYRAFPSDDVSADVAVSGTAIPLSDARVRPEGRRAATLVVAGSLTLFLLAMANLAALHMSRAVARRRESAVTLALGASRVRLWRALAQEGAVPVAAGALLGLGGLAVWLSGTEPFDPLGTLGRGFFSTFTALSMDARVAGWWALVTAGALLLAAALPAFWAVRRTTLSDLRAGARGSAGTGLSLRRPGTPAIILGIEAALAVVLVIAAAQLVESYRRMQEATIGVEPDRVLTFEVQPSERAVPQERAAGFIDRVIESVREVPGVVSASVDGGAPLSGSANTRLHVVGQPADPVTGPPLVLRHYVGPDHFGTLGIPLRAGRVFTDADREGAPGVVIISESAARQYFPGGDAVGQRVWFSGSTMTSPATAGEIVGIVGDVKYDPLLGERTMASFYTPYTQFTYGWRVYFVKVAGEPMAMARAIAAAVGRVAPDLPLLNVRPLADVLSASTQAPRRTAQGTGVLALLGLLLAASGIWAVVSHAVSQRTKEMAIRIAHGATTGRVTRLVLRDGLAWPAAGLLVGAVVSLASSAALQSLLYGIAPGDPVLVLAGAGAFLLVAAVACLAPALRAARVNPIDVLRAD